MRIYNRTTRPTKDYSYEYFIKTISKFENNYSFTYSLYVDDYSQSYFFEIVNPITWKIDPVSCGSFVSDYMSEINYYNKGIITMMKGEQK